MPTVYDRAIELPPDLLESCRPMPLPQRVLMCPPDFFEVIDVKNPFMEGRVGTVDHTRAAAQWQAVADAFRAAGADVELIHPVDGLEDMVFCANQTFIGPDDEGRQVCILGNMKFESRQREVRYFADYFAERGYDVQYLVGDEVFEGSGDALWHPGRGLIWGGYGHRTEPDAYEQVSDFFDVPVIRLRLATERFYHLDTAFCAIDERTALVHPAALAPAGLDLLRAVFSDIIEVADHEAELLMACNATAIAGQHVIIQSGCAGVIAALRERGLIVHPVDTSEFIKSGGSVFCLKMYLF
jgi:N-dimethylarginine dimethylaminohydrolase